MENMINIRPTQAQAKQISDFDKNPPCRFACYGFCVSLCSLATQNNRQLYLIIVKNVHHQGPLKLGLVLAGPLLQPNQPA